MSMKMKLKNSKIYYLFTEKISLHPFGFLSFFEFLDFPTNFWIEAKVCFKVGKNDG